MKSPYLNFLASTISRLDPIYPRDPFLQGSQMEGPTDHGHSHHSEASHGGGHGAESGPPLGMQVAQYAALLAMLSGLSMPIGAMIGLKLRPAHTTVAQWIAVGAGALLFAVSVELYAHAIHSYHKGYMQQVPMIILLACSLLGSFGFTLITKTISGDEDSDDENEEAVANLSDQELTDFIALCEKVGHSDVEKYKAEQAKRIEVNTPKMSPRPRSARSFSPAATTTSPQAATAAVPPPGTPMSQQPPLARASTSSMGPLELGATTSKSESAFKRVAKTRRGVQGLQALMRQVESHRKLMAQKRWAHLREAMKKYHVVRYMQKMTQESKEASGRADKADTKRSTTNLNVQFWDSMKQAWGQTNDSGPNPEELNHIQKENRAAALNMLAMLSVDGVPEGILMGFMAAGGSLGVTFIISLFIANFPEAFAGGVLMLEGGFNTMQIISMWTGLMLLVSSCAGISCHMLLWLNPTYTGGHSAPLSIQILVALTEGLAGGAMISGIAACMLPEAYERRDKKGAIVLSGGFLCTFGFLLSLGIKIVLD